MNFKPNWRRSRRNAMKSSTYSHHHLRLAFMELKREVARKAAFSRTDKPIPERQIDEWEERELDKNKIVHTFIYD